jgi:hypothetical protein
MASQNALLKRAEPDIATLQESIITMQNRVVGRAGTTQGFILAMTLIAFIIGVLLVVIAIAQLLLKGDFVLGAFSSFGGVATVLGTLLYNPMKKAQQSMGDLVQVQIAFLSFNSKVSIWIEYVKATAAKGTAFQQPIIAEVTKDIETAALNALEQIQRYCEDNKPEEQGTKLPEKPDSN